MIRDSIFILFACNAALKSSDLCFDSDNRFYIYYITNYYSVTDNNFQLIVDFWHMLLVNDDDDDVGFSLAFLYDSAMFCFFKYYYFIFYFFLCVRVGVCMIN